MTKLSIDELLTLHDKTRVNVSVGTIKELIDKSRNEGKQEVLKELKAIRKQFDKGKKGCIMTQIPIYRAKKIDSDKHVTGQFSVYKGYSSIFDEYGLNGIEIDPTTLAIHFPDMIDSQGNKIFASLSEDGRGGDILEWTIFPSDTQQQRIKGTPYYSGHGVFGITNRMEMMWHNLEPNRKSKVIGIQQ